MSDAVPCCTLLITVALWCNFSFQFTMRSKRHHQHDIDNTMASLTLSSTRVPPPKTETMFPLHISSHPHIFTTIFHHSPNDTLLALRQVSRQFRHQADEVLVRHLLIGSEGILFLDGSRVPKRLLQPRFLDKTRVLDLVGTPEGYSLAQLQHLADRFRNVDVLRQFTDVNRKLAIASPVYLLKGDAPRQPDMVYREWWGQGHTPLLTAHTQVVKINVCQRHVPKGQPLVGLRFDWDSEVVFFCSPSTQPCRCPPPQNERWNGSRILSGVKTPRLNGIAQQIIRYHKVVTNNKRMWTIVNSECWKPGWVANDNHSHYYNTKWSRSWLAPGDTPLDTVQDDFIDFILCASDQPKYQSIMSKIRFISLEEYRRQVGEDIFGHVMAL